MASRATKLQTISVVSISAVVLASSLFVPVGNAVAATNGDSASGARDFGGAQATFTNNTSSQLSPANLGSQVCANGAVIMPPGAPVAAGDTSSFTVPFALECGGDTYVTRGVVGVTLPDGSGMFATTIFLGGVNWQRCAAYLKPSNGSIWGQSTNTALSTQYTASADGSNCSVSQIPASRAGGKAAVHSRLTHSVAVIKHRKALINVALYSTSTKSRRIADRVVIRDQATNAVLGKTTARLKVGHSGTVSVPLRQSVIKRIKQHHRLGVKVRIRHTGLVMGTGDSTNLMQMVPPSQLPEACFQNPSKFCLRS